MELTLGDRTPSDDPSRYIDWQAFFAMLQGDDEQAAALGTFLLLSEGLTPNNFLERVGTMVKVPLHPKRTIGALPGPFQTTMDAIFPATRFKGFR